MGTRTDHYIGLNDWAKLFVGETQIVHEQGSRRYPNGRLERFDRTLVVRLAKVEVIDSITGMGCRWYDLHRYTMPDGRVYEEFVQASTWSGGPNLFIALVRLKRGQRISVPESHWTKEELSSV